MGKIQAALVASALVASTSLAPSPVSAHKIYKLQGNQWAIICDDGTGYSFSGSEQGANDVAGLVCVGGFTVSPTGPSPNVVTVTRGELLDADKVVVKDAGGRVGLRRGFCPAATPSGARDAYDAFLTIEDRNGDIKKRTASGAGTGHLGMAIDEEGLPVDKKPKKGKGITASGPGTGVAQAAARTGDCTVRPGRPGSNK